MKNDDLDINSWSLEAPAEHQRPPSRLTDLRTFCILGLFFSKTQTLRCFHTSHATRIIKEFRPLRASFGAVATVFLHHPEKRTVVGCGANCNNPNCCRHMVQTLRAKTQPISKWFIVSSSWSQKGQASGWGRFLLANRNQSSSCPLCSHAQCS